VLPLGGTVILFNVVSDEIFAIAGITAHMLKEINIKRRGKGIFKFRNILGKIKTQDANFSFYLLKAASARFSVGIE
jgi:hypothetical protein